MSCMRACPTAAVRVRRGRAMKLADRCIDCGECIRVCPRQAIAPLTDQLADLSKFDCSIAIPSPALYAQFDSEVSPGLVLAGLKECGFDDVEHVSAGCDAAVTATGLYLTDHRGDFPLISSFCPTVVRLVQVQYAELVDQLLPILSPREISAREAKRRKAKETGLPMDRIGAVYITPCPSKMVAIQEHPGLAKSYLDTAVSISDVFPSLYAALERISEPARKDAGETASGVSWAFMVGFPRSRPAENSLCVAGLPNVIRTLDDLEKGKLRRYAFLELYACPEGCVGGCLAVENLYVARAKAIRLWQKLSSGPAVDPDEVERNYRQGEYFMSEPLASRPLRPLDTDISRAIAKMKDRDHVLSLLPGIDCGGCGAPSCRAFAEDVVLGDAEHESCIFLHREKSTRIEEIARMHRPAEGGLP